MVEIKEYGGDVEPYGWVKTIWRGGRTIWASLCGDNLRGEHHFAETISAVSITLQRQSPRSQSLGCASHRWVKLHSAHCGFRIQNFDCLWLLLKGQSASGEVLLGVKHLSWNKKFEVWNVDLLSLKFWLHGVTMHTAESEFLNFFLIKYHGEIETKFENIEIENHVTPPLKKNSIFPSRQRVTIN